jgi:uncharacterized membrane protein YgcG
LRYQVQYRKCDTTAWTNYATVVQPTPDQVNSNAKLMTDIIGLPANTCYEFGVVAYAQNAAVNPGSGLGAATASSSSVEIARQITSGFALGGTPTAHQSTTADSITLNWLAASAPKNLSSSQNAVITYEVEQAECSDNTCAGLNGDWTEIDGDIITTSLPISGLKLNTTYKFRVTPHLQITGTPEMAISTYPTAGAAMTSAAFATLSNPTTPTNLTVSQSALSAENIRGGSVHLAWSASSLLGTAAATASIVYDILCSTDSGAHWNACAEIPGTENLTTTSATIQGLTPGGKYQFKVQAKVGAFNLASESASAVAFNLSNVLQPGEIGVSELEGNAVNVKWTQPTTLQNYAGWDKPDGVSYDVRLSNTTTGVDRVQSIAYTNTTAQNGNSTKFNALADGTYCVSYRIVTASGAGAWSICGAAFTRNSSVPEPDTLHPAAPMILDVDTDDNYELPEGVDSVAVKFKPVLIAGVQDPTSFTFNYGVLSKGQITNAQTLQIALTSLGAADARGYYTANLPLGAFVNAAPGTKFKVEVIAQNANGNSAPVSPTGDLSTGASFKSCAHFQLHFATGSTLIAGGDLPVAETVAYDEILSQRQIDRVNEATRKMERNNTNVIAFLGWSMVEHSQNSDDFWKFSAISGTRMPSHSMTLYGVWKLVNKTEVDNKANTEPAKNSDSEVYKDNKLPNGNNATNADAATVAGRKIKLLAKNGVPLNLTGASNTIQLQVHDNLTISGLGFAPNEFVLIHLEDEHGNLAEVNAISTQSAHISALAVKPVIADEYKSCSETAGVIPCYVQADAHGVISERTVRVGSILKPGTYKLFGFLPAPENTGSKNGFVPVPVVYAQGEASATLAAVVQAEVEVDVVASDPVPTNPTNPTQPTNPTNPTDQPTSPTTQPTDPNHPTTIPTQPTPTTTVTVPGTNGGGASWWACYKDNKFTSDYTTREACTSHGGAWKFVFDGINNGGGGGGGASAVVVGPGGISPNVIISGGGGSSSGGGSPITLTPVINPGENIIINQVPQVDASGQISYPAHNVLQYCTQKGILDPNECVAAGHSWIDLTANADTSNITYILIALGMLLLLFLLLMFLLKRKRDNSTIGMLEQMFRNNFKR